MFDLHVHTIASDGDLDAIGIIKKANENGIKQIAITDHDTINNIKPCIEEGKKYNILVIPGIEITAKYKSGKMHILGYGFDLENEEFKATIQKVRESMISRNLKIIEILNRAGININYEEVIKCSHGNENVRRPHISLAMVKKGLVKSVDDGFDKYLSKPEIENLKRYKLTPKEAIELINKAGGIAVLAHPYTLKLSYSETYKKIKKLKSYGLAGIEVYHSNHNEEQVKHYKEMAEKEQLIITCGSDYHGITVRPEVELGKGKNSNLPTDDTSIFDKFYEKLKKNLAHK